MRGLPLLLVLLLAACGDATQESRPTEQVAAAPAEFWVQAEGELKATKATPLQVPGRNWSGRQLVWMIEDGSPVKAGDVVARFTAAQAQLELDKAMLDLQRNALARASKESELEIGLDRVDVELVQAQAALVIAQRYARADFEALARNTVLDAVQDEKFLGEKTEVLRWRQGQSSERGQAEIQVLDVQRDTIDSNARTRRDDLDALELVAAHDGVFVLSASWSGTRAQIGQQMYAGTDFASLPDTTSLEVELRLPQQEAQGLAVGQRVLLHPLGAPAQVVESELSWVASAPRQINRQSPARYVSTKASVPAEAAQRHGWVPGQAFTGRIVLLDEPEAVTIANVAIAQEGGESTVQVLEDGVATTRAVTLGVRGPARSQVLAGLETGEIVLMGRESEIVAAAEAEAGLAPEATP